MVWDISPVGAASHCDCAASVKPAENQDAETLDASDG